jgi:hypothetical protein
MNLYKIILFLLGFATVNSSNWFERRFVPSTAKPSNSFAQWTGEKCEMNTNVLYSNPSKKCYDYCVNLNSQFNFGKCYIRKGFGECECVYFERD